MLPGPGPSDRARETADLSFLPSQANELNGDQSYHEYRANHAVYRLHRVFLLLFRRPVVTTGAQPLRFADLQARRLRSSQNVSAYAAEQPVTVDFNQTVQEDSPPAF